jgi:hypothetical protein
MRSTYARVLHFVVQLGHDLQHLAQETLEVIELSGGRGSAKEIMRYVPTYQSIFNISDTFRNAGMTHMGQDGERTWTTSTTGF